MSISYTRALAEDLTSGNFIIRNPTVSSGGGLATSTSFSDNNVLGQITTGTSTAASFEGQAGFSFIQDTEFSISVPASITYGSMGVSLYSQNVNTSLNSVSVTDLRGIGSGWTLSVAVTNLTTSGSVTRLAGSNDTVSFTGNYTGVSATNTAATYTAEITTGGVRGVAVFKWTDPNSDITQNITTGATVALSNGISLNFGVATYVTGDKWKIPVDSIGYQSLTLTPNSPTINYGDQNVTNGSSGNFAGTGATSNSRTLINAPPGSGNGSYSQVVGLAHAIHPNTLSGSFISTITLTLI